MTSCVVVPGDDFWYTVLLHLTAEYKSNVRSNIIHRRDEVKCKVGHFILIEIVFHLGLQLRPSGVGHSGEGQNPVL